MSKVILNEHFEILVEDGDVLVEEDALVAINEKFGIEVRMPLPGIVHVSDYVIEVNDAE
jgi:hypothetical protein